MTVLWKKYIVWFAQEFVAFRKAEFLSVVKLFNISIKYSNDLNPICPFWIVELPSDKEAILLASRCVSLRCIIELWAHNKELSAFHAGLKTFMDAYQKDNGSLFTKEKSFRIIVETFNKHYSQSEKIDKIETFDYLPSKGPVNLKCPDVKFYYIEYFGLDPNNVPIVPDDVLFGKWLVDGRRDLITEISLKTRKFIGNTSMDPQLSLLMSNQALVKSGDLVLDPFVGTGSMLVSAAKFGAYVMGTDIDFLMLHGKTKPSRITQKVREKDERVIANLKQYHCEKKYVDVMVSDFSNSIWRNEFQLDSIITDPPYGIRESTSKIEAKERKKAVDSPREDVPHFPSTSSYNLYQLFSDLLAFSARHLKMHGRLVCWFPILREEYTEDSVPAHNCLQLVDNCEQILTAFTARRLLTYEKVFEVTDENSLNQQMKTSLDFRQKFFTHKEETRKERRLKRAELRQIGKEEALKRGKIVTDANAFQSKNVI